MSLDPTYTGLSRKTLEPVPSFFDSFNTKVEASPSKETTKSGTEEDSISFSNENLPKINPSGRAGRFVKPVDFKDKHNIGRSRFDDKGSVLLADIDAVMNLTGHIGGYIANATEFENEQFYSLLFEDHNLEMHSYIQWRRPLSVSRIILSGALIKPHLKTAQLDTVLRTDVHSILTLKPCNGYNVIGWLNYGKETLDLKSILEFILIGLATIDPIVGKLFFVIPFSPGSKVSGSITQETLLDLSIFCKLLFNDVWIFRPYMCYDLICFGMSRSKNDPPKGSRDEKILLGLWESLNLLPKIPVKTSRSTVRPVIRKIAEIESSTDDSNSEEQNEQIVFQTTKNFCRIFGDSSISVIFSQFSSKILAILNDSEPSNPVDRVEVISRWQLPDTIDSSAYGF